MLRTGFGRAGLTFLSSALIIPRNLVNSFLSSRRPRKRLAVAIQFFLYYTDGLYASLFFKSANTMRAFLLASATQVRLAPARTLSPFIQRLLVSVFLPEYKTTDLAP